MATIKTVREHIALREQFWDIHYGPVKRAYGFLRTLMHRQQLVEEANDGLRKRIEEHGTVHGLREAVGDRRAARPSQLKMFTPTGWILLVPALIIRLPFVLVAFVSGLLAEVGEFLSDKSLKIARSLPAPAYNKEYLDENNEYNRKEVMRRFRNG